MVALPPLTKGSLRILRWPASISVIDAHYCSGEGGYLAEADEEGFVYLALRVNAHSAKEECKPTEGKDSGSQELYVKRFSHKHFEPLSGSPLKGECSSPRGEVRWGFFKSAAKVVQKNETAK